MRNLTEADFAKLWPSAPKALVDGILAAQAAMYTKYAINTDLRLAHVWAQFTAETGGGVEMTESLSYTPARLLEIFPTHFTAAQAEEYGHTAAHVANQRMIGDLAYGSRMGNRPGTDDGYNFRGRGLIQTTGRDGYSELAKLTGLDLLNHPELANDPANALHCGLAEFVNYPGMLKYVDADNLLAVSSLINVGHVVTDSSEINGYADRKAALEAWKARLGI